MIASLTGTVLSLSATGAVIDCGGVGLAVTLTPAARTGLRQGHNATVLTHLVVREDALTLYGFASDAEREVFVTVQSVSGIGPRIALALLGTMTPDALSQAVAAGDVTALTRVPGIGQKGAQKLILELTGKLGPLAGGRAASAMAREVSQALVSLGWSSAYADQAVSTVLEGPDAPQEVGELLKAALRHLGTAGGKRG